MTKLILSRVATINRLAAFTITALFQLPGIAAATDIKVISSGGFAAAYRVLAPIFERATGNHLRMIIKCNYRLASVLVSNFIRSEPLRGGNRLNPKLISP